jgi:ABC-2 type transport system ATP-binding protein
VSSEPPVRDAHQGPSGQPTTSETSDPIAALRGVSREFDDVEALIKVDLAIPRGSIVGMIGPSGAGKTTAIRLLTGALRPTSGEVEVLGQDPTRLPAGTRVRIGFMPQHVSLYDDLTVSENLDFVASLYGLFMFRRRRRIGTLLDWLELGDARRRRAGELSGGMRRRLQLACALVHDPELVFLDEPTAGIDPLVRQSIWRELHRLREAGRTLLITTQYVPEAEECDLVALIAEGRLIAFASPEELRRRAFGGQLLDVETSDPVDVDRLQTDLSDGEVRRIGPRRIQVLSQDAATATPAVIAGAEAQGATVTSIHEARPSFDEVFALLVRGSESEETGASARGSTDSAEAQAAATAALPPVHDAGPPGDGHDGRHDRDDDDQAPPSDGPADIEPEPRASAGSTEPAPEVAVR